MHAATALAVAVACVLIGANMRPAITAVGPLLSDIRAATGMSAAAAGLLTTLPLIAFCVVSPLAPKLARRYGIGRALLASLAALALGIGVRSLGGPIVVFAGTALLGAAIAFANVLLPALIKADQPQRVGLLTGLYTTALSVVGGLAAGLSVPLASDAGFGWRGALAVWALPAAAALLISLPALRAPAHQAAPATAAAPLSLRRSRLAWQVTLFFGLQSLLFYSLLTWLPTLLEDAGIGAERAGWLLSLLIVASAVTTMSVPLLATRTRDQRSLVVAVSLATLAGVVGLTAFGTGVAALWVVLVGFGLGGVFSLSLLLIVLRAHDAQQAGALSGMAQSVGYLLAAAGPAGLGLLHDATGSWDPALIGIAVAVVLCLAAGLGAGRDRTLAAGSPVRLTT